MINLDMTMDKEEGVEDKTLETRTENTMMTGLSTSIKKSTKKKILKDKFSMTLITMNMNKKKTENIKNKNKETTRKKNKDMTQKEKGSLKCVEEEVVVSK